MKNGKHYIWTAIGQFGTQFIGLAGNILIARILMPSDYGLIAMLAIIMGLAWNFTESGFADSLIRKRDADRIDFGTVATFNLSIGCIFYLILYISAPGIARFYDQEELTGITRILSLSLIIRSFTLPGIVKLRKSLKFKNLALMHLSTGVIATSLTYIMALSGLGYWALAFQPIFIATVHLLFIVFIAHWRPYFCFDYQRFKEIFSFGVNMLISYITNQTGKNLYSAIIGKFYPVNMLGYYQQALKMQETPTMGLNSVILTTSYSLIAEESNKNIQKEMYHEIFSKFIFLQSLMVLVLIGLAEPIWDLLLGLKWASSVPYFKLFMIIALFYPFETINSNIIKINNRPQLYRNLSFIRNGLKILALIMLVKSSLVTLLYGQIVATILTSVIYIYYGGRIIDFGLIKQLKQFTLIFYKPLIAFISATYILEKINQNKFVEGVIWTFIFFTLYGIMIFLTKDNLFKSVINESKSLFRERDTRN